MVPIVFHPILQRVPTCHMGVAGYFAITPTACTSVVVKFLMVQACSKAKITGGAEQSGLVKPPPPPSHQDVNKYKVIWHTKILVRHTNTVHNASV